MRPAPTDPPEIHRALWDGFEGRVGWDVGANCGQNLPEMTRRFRHVVAFEPAVECYEYLAPWITGAKHVHVEISQLALSDSNGPIELVALPDKISTGQLVTSGITGMEWQSDDDNLPTRVIRARTVDSLIAESWDVPDFLKIDVEGHEMMVIDGAMQTLGERMPDLLIEFHSLELHVAILDVLNNDLGYPDVETIRHPHYGLTNPLRREHGWVRAFGR